MSVFWVVKPRLLVGVFDKITTSTVRAVSSNIRNVGVYRRPASTSSPRITFIRNDERQPLFKYIFVAAFCSTRDFS